MKLGFSQPEIKGTLAELNLPEHSYYMRRAARALDIVNQDKVHSLGEDVFRVDSQYDDKHYLTELNHGNPGCTCEDFKKNSVACKHMIAATIYKKESQAQAVKVTWDDTENSYHKRGRWWVTDYKRKTKYIVYRDGEGKLICPCGRKKDCEHRKAIREYLNNGGGNGRKITNECGSEHAKAIQDQLNGQLDHQGNNGNGDAKSPSPHLDISNPFEESEYYDIQQIEGRRNGELAWKLSNGKYCISYKGIMRLAEKHAITFTDGDNSNTKQVIARARLNGSERISGKLPIPSRATALELAKRNAARQLISLPEIKALEHKVKLEAEFNWQKAYAKCVELVGTEANVDIIIHELTEASKLRQDSPTHYTRTEWLVIHNACKQDAQEQNNDGGDNPPSSNEVNRYKVLADAPVNENWLQRHRECTKLVGIPETDLIISQELNFRYTYYKNKITSELGGGFGRGVCAYPYRMPSPFPPNPPPEDEQWDIVRQECRYRWNAKQAKAEFASAQQAYKFKHIRDISGYDVKAKKYVGRPPLNSKEFLAKCQEAIEKVRAEKNTVEANEQPLEGGNGKRQIQADQKRNIWIIESDGRKVKTTWKDVATEYDSYGKNIITRLKMGLDSGCDISMVELDD